MSKLNAREQLFVAEYLKDGEARAAAVRAGYADGTGTSVTAHRILKRPHVQAEIERMRSKMLERVEMSTEQVIRGFARIALSDLRKLYDEHGNLRPITELDEDTAAALAGIEVEESYKGRGKKRRLVSRVRKVKRWDVVRALENLARINGMFKDTVVVKGDFADRLVKARERARQARP